MSLLEIGGLAAAFWLLFRYVGGQVASRIEFGKPKVRLRGFSPTDLAVDVDLRIPLVNNSGVPLILDWFKGHLAFGEFVVTPLAINEEVRVPPKTSQEVPVQVRVPLADLAGNVAALVSSGDFWRNFRLVGTASVGGLTFNVDQTLVLL